MKFDSMRAWKQASTAIAANREVLAAVAGVCFLLPALVVQLFFPQPEPTAAMDERAILELASNYYVSLLPVLIPSFVLQAVGTLALVLLLGDRSRPTVGEALRAGLHGVVPYLLAQLLLGLCVGLGGGTLLSILTVIGGAPLMSIGLALVLALAAVLLIRTSITAPVIIVEKVRNPVEALRRSIGLTRGNGGRLFVFYLLVLVAFVVLSLVLGLVVALPLALLASAETSRVVNAIVSSAVNAGMALTFVAIITAVHRQLADDRDGEPASTV